MSLTTTLSPVSLSYVAALRGIKPRRPGEAFAYAMVNCQAPDLLIALAASNPEGRFYGLISDASLCVKAAEEALARQVGNISFLRAMPEEALAWIEKGTGTLPPLSYVCCDESETPLEPAARNALLELAEKGLQPGGLFAINYPVAADENGALQFLVREFAPEMNAKQASEFLLDLKKLGGFYFAGHRDLAAKLNEAIVKNMPDAFFGLFDKGDARSATFDTMIGLSSRGLTYAGDSDIVANYIELSVPVEAQQTIVDCRASPLYEAVKDFALNRTIRRDIWCRQPTAMSSDLETLFGGFSYGITLPREKVPESFEAQGKSIPLNAPLYVKLIDLMTLMPVSVGDALSHPECKGFAAEDVVGAVHILVACGVARPMRGLYKSTHMENITQPRLVGSFNQYLDKTAVMGNGLPLASPVLGDVMTISPRDALVMQALDRAGLANSVAALLPELQRLALNPSQAARIMDHAAPPTAETARQMIEDVVTQSIVQWYAYGLLEAA